MYARIIKALEVGSRAVAAEVGKTEKSNDYVQRQLMSNGMTETLKYALCFALGSVWTLILINL